MARRLMLAMALAFGLVTGTAAADERVDGFAHALRADPVVVSSALTRAVPPAEVAALRRTVEAAPLRTFVVVAPSFGGEPGLETLRALPDLLHDRLGREGSILLSTSRRSRTRRRSGRSRASTSTPSSSPSPTSTRTPPRGRRRATRCSS